MGTEAEEQPHGAAVVADGFGLKGPRGWAFRKVSFRAEPGALVAIEGPSGSGRTCLLLALTGRMKAKEGHAEVGGLPLPRKMAAVRRISALGQVPGVNELDPAFTVAEHLHERALLQHRFDGSVRALLRRPGTRAAQARARIEEAVAAAGLDLDALPKGGRTSVRDLERLEALRLSIALALIGRPRLLAVDDTDLKLSDSARAEVWTLLRSLTATGTTVLAVCSEAPEGALRITTETPETPEAQEAQEAPETSEASEAPEAPAKVSTEKTADAPKAAGPEDAAEAPRTDSDTDTATGATASTTEEGAADALAETGRS